MAKFGDLFTLTSQAWQLRSQYYRAARYRLDNNALRMGVRTYRDLTQPPANCKRLVLFAHYDPQNVIDPYVQYYLRKLHELNCAIVFVSGSPNLLPEAAKTIEQYCVGIYTRDTLSLDFGSWHLAWQQLKKHGWLLETFEQLILANDSVYGPFFDLSEMFAQFGDKDLCGVTDSVELAYHLQSYFLSFQLSTEVRRFVERFWSEFRYVVRKAVLIRRYEIGLSRLAQKNGLSLYAYAPHEAVREAALRDPTHQHRQQVLDPGRNNSLYLWDILISQFRCPFLKTDLPKNNRLQSKKILELEGWLQQWTEYDPGLIQRHVDRLRRDS